MTPHQARELLFCLLFVHDSQGSCEEESAELLTEELSLKGSDVEEGTKRLTKLLAKREEIDALIVQHAKDYTLERIPSVERNLLRIALYELTIEQEVPPKVILSEAVRLARKFATPSASSFVNGLLDAVYQARLT